MNDYYCLYTVYILSGQQERVDFLGSYNIYSIKIKQEWIIYLHLPLLYLKIDLHSVGGITSIKLNLNRQLQGFYIVLPQKKSIKVVLLHLMNVIRFFFFTQNVLDFDLIKRSCI